MSKGKKSKGMWGTVAVFMIAGLIFGAIAGYYVKSDRFDEGRAAGIAYQQSRDRVGVPASLTVNLSAATFSHASTVSSDGSVSTECVEWDTLTIENTDDTRTAGDVKVVLKNPVNDKEGLNDNLETDNTEFAVVSGAGGTYKLFDGGDYITDGYSLGDISPGGSWSLNVSMTLEVAAAGTFQDGQEYTCYLYVYQDDADYSDVLTFTVTT